MYYTRKCEWQNKKIHGYGLKILRLFVFQLKTYRPLPNKPYILRK